ncbi:hypothetical protein [Agrobacterium sp. SORGH_AS 787]|uniref:hypothetical protein n=1 Tax=Agrobacterium sp. SORGH_AS 787 TaxID=3041775 RepID=UPI0027867C8C|nr:hypothetical protein [Rhizobium sp. SORGH_AS_0787]
MTNVKLHINITQGIIDAEGDQDFVWRVYEDFKDRIVSINPSAAPPIADNQDATEVTPDIQTVQADKQRKKPKRRASPVAVSTGGKEKSAPRITSHKPRLLHDLDTGGIKEFLAQFNLTNNSDIIAAIGKFLETKGRPMASVDAYFTCFHDASIKPPEAFGQAFVKARGNTKGYITFTTADDIELTIRGRNRVDHGDIKKTVDA